MKTLTLTFAIIGSLKMALAHAECPESLSDLNNNTRFSGKNLIAQCRVIIRHDEGLPRNPELCVFAGKFKDNGKPYFAFLSSDGDSWDWASGIYQEAPGIGSKLKVVPGRITGTNYVESGDWGRYNSVKFQTIYDVKSAQLTVNRFDNQAGRPWLPEFWKKTSVHIYGCENQ